MRTRVNPLGWLRGQGHKLAALTGADEAALVAAFHLFELWGRSDSHAREHVCRAIWHVRETMLPHNRHLLAELVPCALDWQHKQEIGDTLDGYGGHS